MKLGMFKIYEFLETSFKGITSELLATKQYTGVGDGGVVLATSSDSNVILVWDGREHIDINLFMHEESSEKSKNFIDSFVKETKNKLSVSLRDDQPRGIGGVVNFPSDLDKSK